MKKLLRLLSIFTITASIGFISCKGDPGETGPIGAQGTQGTPGTNGTNGKDGSNGKDGINGNANVKAFSATVKVADWKPVDVTSAGSGVTTKWGGVAITNAEISAGKYVVVFLKNGLEQKALPLFFTIDANNSVERLDYGFETGKLYIYYRNQTSLSANLITAPIKDLDFEYLTLEKSGFIEMQNSGINMKDAAAVKAYLGL